MTLTGPPGWLCSASLPFPRLSRVALVYIPPILVALLLRDFSFQIVLRRPTRVHSASQDRSQTHTTIYLNTPPHPSLFHDSHSKARCSSRLLPSHVGITSSLSIGDERRKFWNSFSSSTVDRSGNRNSPADYYQILVVSDSGRGIIQFQARHIKI